MTTPTVRHTDYCANPAAVAQTIGRLQGDRLLLCQPRFGGCGRFVVLPQPELPKPQPKPEAEQPKPKPFHRYLLVCVRCTDHIRLHRRKAVVPLCADCRHAAHLARIEASRKRAAARLLRASYRG